MTLIERILIIMCVVSVILYMCYDASTGNRTDAKLVDLEQKFLKYHTEKGEITALSQDVEFLIVPNTGGHRIDDFPHLPPESVDLLITAEGLSTDRVVASVAPEHREWLLEELKGMNGISWVYNDTPQGSTGKDFKYTIFLSRRIGRDDWDALFALPGKLKDVARIFGPAPPEQKERQPLDETGKLNLSDFSEWEKIAN